MTRPMRIRANAENGVVEVKVLMNHEMETGQRRDSSGNIVPAWFITEVTGTLNDKVVMTAQWGPAVSKNPYLAFKCRGAVGDTVAITWVDNRNETRTDTTTVR